MTLPNFLIIGVQKAGSSWLSEMLGQHPDIYMYPKEIHFFDKGFNWEKGVAWYENHFTQTNGAKFIGEKTPDYLWANGKGAEDHLPDVHVNIHRTLENPKLIVILRDPVHRAVSAANHIIRSGRISPLNSLDELLIGGKRHLLDPHGVIDYGFYRKQLEAYYNYFDSSKILILIYEEDVVLNPEAGLKKVCNFLGADDSYHFSEMGKYVNVGNGSKPWLAINYYLPSIGKKIRFLDHFLKPFKLRPQEETIKKLYNIYDKENKELFELIGRGIDSWKRK